MSTKINLGWLKDNNGEKFAPKTLSSQVITSEGITIEDKINKDIENILINLNIPTDEYINNLIDAKLKAIENGSYE